MFGWLAQALAWFYSLTHSYGTSIVLLTLSIMILLTPLTLKGTRSMIAMQRYQPEMKRLQNEFKHDRQKLNEEMLKFYREHKINPLGGCLPLLAQAPVFIVLWRVLHGLTRKKNGLFDPDYVSKSSEIYKALAGKHEMLSWGLDLSQSAVSAFRESFGHGVPYAAMVVLYAGTSLYQQKQIMARTKGQQMTPQQEQQQKIMKYLPLLFSIIALNFASGLLVYLLASNAYRILQQAFIAKTMPMPTPNASTVIDVKAKPESKAPAKPRPTQTGRVTPKGGTTGNSQQRPTPPPRGPRQAPGRNRRAGGNDDKKDR